MTRVCLVGEEGVNLQYELLSRETARDALASYDLQEPFENSLAVETISLGSAVSLLNDLDWYLARFVEEALVYEPSVSESEWLSRDLATAIRDDRIDPDETGRFLKVYGLETRGSEREQDGTGDRDGSRAGEDGRSNTAEGESYGAGSKTSQPRLVEPMLVARTGKTIPEYDLRDVDETLLVRVTESEFGA
jgi:hypothetical protein